MICILSFIVLGILGIFSTTHRQLAKEAFRCVAKRIILRPCITGFDKKIKSKIVGKILKRNQPIGKFVHKYFQALAWVFVILMTVSFIYSALGIYNLIRYKTCDPAHPENCILTPKQIDKGCTCEQACEHE